MLDALKGGRFCGRLCSWCRRVRPSHRSALLHSRSFRRASIITPGPAPACGTLPAPRWGRCCCSQRGAAQREAPVWQEGWGARTPGAAYQKPRWGQPLMVEASVWRGGGLPGGSRAGRLCARLPTIIHHAAAKGPAPHPAPTPPHPGPAPPVVGVGDHAVAVEHAADVLLRPVAAGLLRGGGRGAAQSGSSTAGGALRLWLHCPAPQAL